MHYPNNINSGGVHCRSITVVVGMWRTDLAFPCQVLGEGRRHDRNDDHKPDKAHQTGKLLCNNRDFHFDSVLRRVTACTRWYEWEPDCCVLSTSFPSQPGFPFCTACGDSLHRFVDESQDKTILRSEKLSFCRYSQQPAQGGSDWLAKVVVMDVPARRNGTPRTPAGPSRRE